MGDPSAAISGAFLRGFACAILLVMASLAPEQRAVAETLSAAVARDADWTTQRADVPTPPTLGSGFIPHAKLFDVATKPSHGLPEAAVNRAVDSDDTDTGVALRPVAEAMALQLYIPDPDEVKLPQFLLQTRAALSKKVVEITAASSLPTLWSVPQSLLDQLDDLATERATRAWATETQQLIAQLMRDIPSDSQRNDAARQADTLVHLQSQAAQVESMAARLRIAALARTLRRAGHALNRRLAVWGHIVHHAALPAAASLPLDREGLRNRKDLLSRLDALEATIDTGEVGEAWREYLLLDGLRHWPTTGNVSQASLGQRKPSAEVASKILLHKAMQRIDNRSLSSSQREFLASKPVSALRAELRRLTADSVDVPHLLQLLERYEATTLASDARHLARARTDLTLAQTDAWQPLAGRLNAHYRNANCRIAITEKLLNLMIPQRDPECNPIDDTVLGIPVSGESVTVSDVSIGLIPDPRRILLSLDVTGQIAAETYSSSGPATFHNTSQSIYRASKPIEFDLSGLHLYPAEVAVSNQMRLRSLETDFDDIPLIGSIVQNIARTQHAKSQPAAQREVKWKIGRKAQRKIDFEADTRLGHVSQRMKERILAPLDEMDLKPTMVSTVTTNQRIVMRLRLADDDQLGAHTPRPRALANSLASLQVHQSVLNNLLQQLDLDNHTFTMSAFASHISKRLHLEEPWTVDTASRNVQITFAKNDAADVHFENGRVAITLSIARLHKSRKSWRNFQIRAYYRPDVEGLRLRLIRDGIIHLMGPRRSTTDQIALRGVFNRIFSERRPLNLTPARLQDGPQFKGLTISQCLIDDGWIALALGHTPSFVGPIVGTTVAMKP